MLRLDIEEKYSRPKYQQVVQSIIDNIEQGNLQPGELLPSVNQVSFQYDLSKDTVERAYKVLKDQGIITAIKGKGCYVKSAAPQSKLKVLVLFNKLSTYKKVIYNQMAHRLVEKAHLTLHVYHCRLDLFESILKENRYGFNYYVIMPHFLEGDQKQATELIKTLDPEKLIFIDHIPDGIDKYKGAVHQDFKMDIYKTMVEALEPLRKYNHLTLVFPENSVYPYPRAIIEGFRRFCGFHSFDYQILPEIPETLVVTRGTAFITIAEGDLVKLIKHIRGQQLRVGQEVGILSYNDTPLKEILENGISVMTTHFEEMGDVASQMVLNKTQGRQKNKFHLILRSSL